MIKLQVLGWSQSKRKFRRTRVLERDPKFENFIHRYGVFLDRLLRAPLNTILVLRSIPGLWDARCYGASLTSTYPRLSTFKNMEFRLGYIYNVAINLQYTSF